MTGYILVAEAKEELEAAIDYYDSKRSGLGGEFLDQVVLAISVIRTRPESFPRISARSRRCPTRRFPYGIVYQMRDDSVRIIADMHLHRRPGYWSDREQ